MLLANVPSSCPCPYRLVEGVVTTGMLLLLLLLQVPVDVGRTGESAEIQTRDGEHVRLLVHGVAARVLMVRHAAHVHAHVHQMIAPLHGSHALIMDAPVTVMMMRTIAATVQVVMVMMLLGTTLLGFASIGVMGRPTTAVRFVRGRFLPSSRLTRDPLR